MGCVPNSEFLESGIINISIRLHFPSKHQKSVGLGNSIPKTGKGQLHHAQNTTLCGMSPKPTHSWMTKMDKLEQPLQHQRGINGKMILGAGLINLLGLYATPYCVNLLATKSCKGRGETKVFLCYTHKRASKTPMELCQHLGWFTSVPTDSKAIYSPLSLQGGSKEIDILLLTST